MKKILSGNEAIALGAYEYGVQFASAYPGTPSTEILQHIKDYPGIFAEWAPNEKVALEAVVGATLTGARGLAAMKHVGLNVAADPFMTLAYTGVRGGLVIVSADDPEMHSSQNEQDNRYYGKFAQVPVLEPSDSQEAKDMVGIALELSEQFDTPVILRITTRVAHSKTPVEMTDKRNVPPVEGFKHDAIKQVMIPAHAKMRHPLVLERLAKLKDWAEHAPINIEELNDPKIGIITSGVAYEHAKEILPDASYFKLGMVYPLPEQKIKAFANKVERVLVIEELEPFLEEEIRLMGVAVEGKALFTRLGELNPERVTMGLYHAGLIDKAPAPAYESLPGASMPRPPLLCAGCSHRGINYAIKKLKGIIHSDIGCYALAVAPPLQTVDTNLCMGASISMAHGTAKVMDFIKLNDKRPVLATIGDSTFFHSGITSLLDVVYNQSNVTVVILDNRITAMTGAQDNPGTGRTLMGQPAPKVDFIELCKALGVRRVTTVDPYDLAACEKVLREEIAADEPSVIITTRPCIQLRKVNPDEILEVKEDKCIGCGLCFGLGCPAIYKGKVISQAEGKKERKQAAIDPTLCYGCTMCVQVCKSDAIGRIAK